MKFLNQSAILSLIALVSAGVSSGWAGDLQDDFYINSEGSPLIPLIQSAQSSLRIEIYTMSDWQVRNEIRNALKRGVQVQIVQDPTPFQGTCFIFEGQKSSQSNGNCNDQKALVKEVNAVKGSTYVAFNKSELCGISGVSSNCYEHGKIALVDDQEALISTGNFDATNLCDLSQSPANCNRDYTVVARDPLVVATLSRIFAQDLVGVRYDLSQYLTGEVSSRLTVSPYSLAPLVDLINSARSSLVIENQYLKEPKLNQAISQAAARGVQVSVTVESDCAFGKPAASEVKSATAVYTAFDQAGVSTRMFTHQTNIGGRPGYLHAKAIVVDHSIGWVGSVNGSTTSVSENREYGIYLNSRDAVARLEAQMLNDHNDSGTESWQQSLQCAKD